MYGVDRSWGDPMIRDHSSWTWTVGHTLCYAHRDPVSIIQRVMCITVLAGQRLWELSVLSKIPAWTWLSQDWNPRPCRPGSLPRTALLLLTWNISGTDGLPCSMMSPRLVCLCTKKKVTFGVISLGGKSESKYEYFMRQKYIHSDLIYEQQQ